MCLESNKYIELWHDNIDLLKAINADTEHSQYEQAISLCTELYKNLEGCVDSDEYIQFLSLYADIVSLGKDNIDKEIDIQEEIVKIRRKQSDANGGVYLKKLSNSLCYAALLHRQAVNIHKAIDCMEEHRSIEVKIAEGEPIVKSVDAILATFRLADLYDDLGRNVLAEDFYMEAIAMTDLLLNNDKANAETHSVMLSGILIEFATFYIKSNMIDSAIDRYIQAIDALRPYEKNNQDVAIQIKSLYQQLYNIYEALGDVRRANHYKELLK